MSLKITINFIARFRGGGMGKKKDKKHKLVKPRGPLIPPNKPHKSKKAYDRKKAKGVIAWK